MQENLRERKGRINFQRADLTFQKSFITNDSIAATAEQHKRDIQWRNLTSSPFQVMIYTWSSHVFEIWGKTLPDKSISKVEGSKTKC